MDFFNKAKDSFVAAGKGFSQKANDVSGLAKITVKIKEEEKQLQKALQDMGLGLYNEKNAEAHAMFPALASRIQELYAELEQDRIELAFLKGKKICPNCGMELDNEVQRCTSCGMNVENVERPVPRQKLCSNCGSPILDNANFCLSCGTKIEN